MKRFATLALALAAAAAAPALAAPPMTHAADFRGHELAGSAVALRARPGAIVDKELEKEAGGSGLRYAFDITSHGKTYEVGVDARTGKVLENGAESAAKEAQEVRQEKAEARH
jgi:opacity protein-like surface antigen